MTYKSQSLQKFSRKRTDKSPMAHCFKEARTCLNYEIKCNECVKIQGKYTEYKGE